MSTAIPRHCVIDASVLIKYVIPEDETPLIRHMLRELLADVDATLFVPDLLFIECANILWKKVQRGEIDAQTAQHSLGLLEALELDTTPIPELMASALRLACEHQISAYDACYIALSEQLGLPLLTADIRLANRLAGTRHNLLIVGQSGGTTRS